MIGRVVSTKMQKTAVVLIERTAIDTLYKKTFKRSKKYLVDDPIGVKDGDMVEIIKISPVSKNKHWKVAKVVGKNLAEIAEEKLKKEAEEIISEVMPEEKEETKLETENNEKEIVVDNSTEKPVSKKKGKQSLPLKKGRTELSKKK